MSGGNWQATASYPGDRCSAPTRTGTVVAVPISVVDDQDGDGLPDGKEIEGPADLRRALMSRPGQVVQALTVKLMMYALGREIAPHDMPQVRAIVRAAAKNDYRFSSIVAGIVSSDAFRMQAREE